MEKEKEFDELIQDSSASNVLQMVMALIVMSGLAVFFIYWGIRIGEEPVLFLIGIGIIIGLIFLFIQRKGEFNEGNFWLGIIKENPDNIVWIDPIVTKEKVAYIITVHESLRFHIRTKDGLKTFIKCNSAEQKAVFWEGIKTYLPHVHIGYSSEVNDIYNQNPQQFIEILKEKELYTPVSYFGL